MLVEILIGILAGVLAWTHPQLLVDLTVSAIAFVIVLLATLTHSRGLALVGLVPFGIWSYLIMYLFSALVDAAEVAYPGSKSILHELMRPVATLIMGIGALILCCAMWPGLLGMFSFLIVGFVLITGGAGIYFGTRTHLFQWLMIVFLIITILFAGAGAWLQGSVIGRAANDWLKEENSLVASKIGASAVQKAVERFFTGKKGELAGEVIRQVKYDQWESLGWGAVPVYNQEGNEGPNLNLKWVLIIEKNTTVPEVIKNKVTDEVSMTKIRLTPQNKAATYYLPTRAIDLDTPPPANRLDLAKRGTAGSVFENEVGVEETKAPINTGVRRVKVGGECWINGKKIDNLTYGEYEVISATNPPQGKNCPEEALPANIRISGGAIKIDVNGDEGWVPAFHAEWLTDAFTQSQSTAPGTGDTTAAATQGRYVSTTVVFEDENHKWPIQSGSKDADPTPMAGLTVPGEKEKISLYTDAPVDMQIQFFFKGGSRWVSMTTNYIHYAGAGYDLLGAKGDRNKGKKIGVKCYQPDN